jgi:hypothetical protein
VTGEVAQNVLVRVYTKDLTTYSKVECTGRTAHIGWSVENGNG